MKSKGTAYLLWAIGGLGCQGLHHFYLDKPVKGIIWLLTLGIGGIGALIDLFTLGGQVDNVNTQKELATIRTNALSQHAKGGQGEA
jgi:TM2 domain-containing membrane protein YozV